jgi:hypothetical protein
MELTMGSPFAALIDDPRLTDFSDVKNIPGTPRVSHLVVTYD